MVGINDVAIVVGYEKEQIIAHVNARKLLTGKGFASSTNPAFAITNNIYSLWLAVDWLRGDNFFVLNGRRHLRSLKFFTLAVRATGADLNGRGPFVAG